jgi:hypothetical protein
MDRHFFQSEWEFVIPFTDQAESLVLLLQLKIVFTQNKKFAL